MREGAFGYSRGLLWRWPLCLLALLPMLFSVNELWSLDDLVKSRELFAWAGAAAVLLWALIIATSLIDGEGKIHGHENEGLSLLWTRGGAALLAVATLSAAFLLEVRLGLILTVYLAVRVSYSLALKRVWLMDLFAQATAIVLMLVAGAAAISAPVSPWLYLCAWMGALHVGLVWRRGELAGRAGSDIPKLYSIPVVDHLIGTVGAATLSTYALYTFMADSVPDNHAMTLTIPIVLYGLFRYMLVVHAGVSWRSPEETVLRDRPAMLAIVLWLGVSVALMIAYK